MDNKKRFIVNCIYEYAEKNNLLVSSHSYEWFFRLKNETNSHLIFGYDLGLNSSSVHQVCKDKSATFEILNHAGISAIEHKVHMHPRFRKHLPSLKGNWKNILDDYSHFNSDVVLKPNEGTSGDDVYRVKNNSFELEEIAHSIFVQERSLAISPYTNIIKEIRLYILKESVVFGVEKQIPVVKGNGKLSIQQLANNQLDKDVLENLLNKNPEIIDYWKQAPIPPKDEYVKISWKFNLGKGANSQICSQENIAPSVIAIGLAAAKIIGLQFGSVDIAITDSGPAIMELNSGVMVEHLVRSFPDQKELAKKLYFEALDSIFVK